MLAGRMESHHYSKLLRTALPRGAITVLNFCLFAIIGEIAGIEAIGYYGAYHSSVILTGILCSFGLPYLLLRRASLHTDASKAYLASLRTPYWVAAIAPATVFGFVAFIIFLIKPSIFSPLPPISFIVPPLYAISLLASEEMKGRGRIFSSILIENMGTIIAPTLISTLLLLFVDEDLDAENILYILVFSSVISMLITISIYLIKNGLNLKQARWLKWGVKSSAIRRELSDLATMRTLSGISGNSSVLLCAVFFSSEILGYVTIITRLFGLANTFTLVIATTYASRIGAQQRNPAVLMKLYRDTRVMALVCVGFLCGIYSLFPALFIRAFSVEPLSGAIWAIRIIAIGRLVRAWAGLAETFLLFRRESRMESLAVLISQVILFLGLYSATANLVHIALVLAFTHSSHGLISSFFVHRALSDQQIRSR